MGRGGYSAYLKPVNVGTFRKKKEVNGDRQGRVFQPTGLPRCSSDDKRQRGGYSIQNRTESPSLEYHFRLLAGEMHQKINFKNIGEKSEDET